MEHLHFGVTLCHLLQQLEEQTKYGLQVLCGVGKSHCEYLLNLSNKP